MTGRQCGGKNREKRDCFTYIRNEALSGMRLMCSNLVLCLAYMSLFGVQRIAAYGNAVLVNKVNVDGLSEV